jgi:two-component system KDP operon response regulator KdpE
MRRLKGLQGNILVIDDDAELRRVLKRTLGALGFEVADAANGEQALQELAGRAFDVVLMDVNMPGIGGIAACQAIRQRDPRLQILMLSVRDEETDKIEAFNAGADDYITKPFAIGELVARLRSAVRRHNAASAKAEMPITIGDIELDVARRIVRKAGAAVRLTPKEFDLLHYLMSRPGVPVAHAHLLRAVWGEEYGHELEYLRTFVRQLRKKLEDDPSSPKYLLTELSFGYRFAAPADADFPNAEEELDAKGG